MSESKTEKTEKKKSKKAGAGPRRTERRFVAQSSNNPWLVRVLGGLGGAVLGAGAWGYTYGHAFDADEKLKPVPAYLIAAGAVLTGATIWLGTSSDMPLRVGDPGISMERGEVRRMPWWAVSQITWESGNLALAITGKDEAGTSWSFKVPVKSHAEAVGWILKEALDRVPKVVDISDMVVEKLPGAGPHAGMKIDLEPLQVVGKKDAVTGKLISYEPDARICTRCERVYHKKSVPKRCKCGSSLLQLRASVGELEDEDENEDENDDDLEDEASARDDDELDDAGAGSSRGKRS